MLNLIILILLTIFLYLQFKKILEQRVIKQKNDHRRIKDEQDKLISENKQLKAESFALEKTVEETIAIYDITKEICKSLDADKVFSSFREQINKYIKIRDCRFLKDDSTLSQYKNYTVLPLNIEKNTVGYLIANKINEQDKDKFHILSQQFILGIKRALLYQEVQELAITDSLTGVFSRRHLLGRFREEWERSKKFKYKFSFLMVDIDYFKDYNDRYGHLVGDAILRAVSQTIRENIRQIDLVGRYGGEEFSIVLTETNKEGARFAAERIRQAIEQKNIRVYDEDLKITVSIGAAVFPDDATDLEALIDNADQALYQAKHLGRNRVCIS